MTLVKPGRYSANVLEHGISETKAGDPQAVVKFEFEVDGSKRELTWFGSFKEKALPFTLDALVACGLKGNNPAGALEIGKEVSIVIEKDVNDEGKERNVIRWVNRPSMPIKKMDSVSANAKLEKYAAAVMAIKAKNPAQADDEDSVPF